MVRRKDRAARQIPSVSRHLASLLVLLLLSGCAQGGVASLFGLGAKAKRDAAPRAGIHQIDLSSARGTLGPAEGTEPAVDDNPQKLIGLAPSRLAEQLGSPGFVRRDGPAEVWQYAAEDCILDVFLYHEGNALKVSYVALRGRGAAGQSRRECYAGMLRSQAAQRQG